ncbi:transcriptional regulator YcdC [Escherichia coli]|uniref:Transcriptional regulator YcdC n=1 Tax=Escherichia coli TaxID=562 RepID=A0A376ZY23_ECOLX|nr:transcriptional regulator YcdC [Escherichia coli]
MKIRSAGGDKRVHPSEAGSLPRLSAGFAPVCMEMLAGAPLLMDELTGDLKALIDEKSALIAGWVKSGKLAPIDPQHLIS